jgi:SAM-dependent methyltransferase
MHAPQQEVTGGHDGPKGGGSRQSSSEFGLQPERHAPAGPYDVVVSGLVLNFIPDVSAGLAEMVRVTKPGGTVAAYVWDYAGKMELMRYFWDAAVALKPEDRERDEGRRFSLCQPEPLSNVFTEAGLHDIEVRSIDVPTPFRDFDDYWSPFLGGQFGRVGVSCG